MIPSREECLKLLKKYGYFKENVPIVHAELVAEVALHLSDMLISKGVKIDTRVVGAAALMHDIGKANKENINHTVYGYKICVEEGLDKRICIAIKNHDVEGVMHGLKTWEEKVVSYSDKICNTRIFGLEERFIDWRNRYPENYRKHKSQFDKSHDKSILLEKEILDKLGLTSHELYDILRRKSEKHA
jgi:putative nucleotidyltransferase with HDIG domain